MKPLEKTYDVGVICARFQCWKLTDAHKELIQTVLDKHPKVIISLGLSPLKTTYNNPLDFQCRKQMLLELYPPDKYPNLTIVYTKDVPDDYDWSKKIDEQIADLIGPGQTVVLYGGRDSCLKDYHGKLPTIELEPIAYVSATELRNVAHKAIRPTEDFRAGIIHATGNKYPICYPTVDIAIVDETKNRLLLARKLNEKLYRFVGGFAEPTSPSYEADAKREVMEKTGVEVADLKYVGSALIPDWRLEKERDKIKTLFFCAKYIFGCPKANDDICDVRWFDLSLIKVEDIVEEHRVLLMMLRHQDASPVKVKL